MDQHRKVIGGDDLPTNCMCPVTSLPIPLFLTSENNVIEKKFLATIGSIVTCVLITDFVVNGATRAG